MAHKVPHLIVYLAHLVRYKGGVRQSRPTSIGRNLMETAHTAPKAPTWFIGLRFDQSYLVDPATGDRIDYRTCPQTGERTKFKSVKEVWEEKARLERRV